VPMNRGRDTRLREQFNPGAIKWQIAIKRNLPLLLLCRYEIQSILYELVKTDMSVTARMVSILWLLFQESLNPF